MKRLLRPAFVVTTCATLGACSDPKAPPDGSASAKSGYTMQGGHPHDADGNIVFFRGAGSCYVQKDKKEPPPKDLMSGERWVEDVDVPCPKEFDDPAFAAISAGEYWIQDSTTGECSKAQMFGNPPPPPVVTPCPPVLEKK